ncbi:MAG TPA: SLOG family protein, partial [Pirellulales bacterium]
MGKPAHHLRASKLEQRVAPLLPFSASYYKQRAARLASGHVVIVTGGRDYANRDFTFAALDRVHAHRAITLIVYGACFDRATGEPLGADRWADE